MLQVCVTSFIQENQHSTEVFAYEKIDFFSLVTCNVNAMQSLISTYIYNIYVHIFIYLCFFPL